MFKSCRKFQLWDYHVSHKQALIRSPVSPGFATNIDVVFWGVESLYLPTSLDGMCVGMTEAIGNIPLPIMLSMNGKLFEIKTGEHNFCVVAAGCKVLENYLDIFESSLEGFAATNQSRDLGVVLAHS